MASNSTITLQSVVDHARTFNELTPVLSVSGYELQPALTIASDVMATMLAPGMNWKWNRFKVPVWYTNAWQQDYAVPGVVLLQWLEHGFIIDINNTALPTPFWPVECVRDLDATSWQVARIGQVCWLPNDQLTYGTWQPNAFYNQILGTPANSTTPTPPWQIQDPNGNFWVVSNMANQSVQTGITEPTWPTTPVYPTYSNPTQAPTTVNDNTVVWMAINPKGQGFRVNPLPSAGSLYFQVNLIGQKRPPQFINLQQTLDPIPDDYATFFRQGFIAHAYRHSPDPRIRAKAQDAIAAWSSSMTQALTQAMREREEAGFFPTESVTSGAYPLYIGPANPFYPAGF